MLHQVEPLIPALRRGLLNHRSWSLTAAIAPRQQNF